MYRCFDCDKEFEEPIRLPVFEGEYWGAPFVEYGECCPYCKSDDIAEVKYQCDCCGHSIVEGEVCYITNDDRAFCENCINHKGA